MFVIRPPRAFPPLARFRIVVLENSIDFSAKRYLFSGEKTISIYSLFVPERLKN